MNMKVKEMKNEKLKNILIKERISHDEIINDLNIKHTETDVAVDIAINKLKGNE